ncbi:MAG: hypothetical protein F4187_07750 [Gemmatimonadetes bacterium]|nr:hypothetical protein [Gemmatimonadota bacterium]
MVANAGPLWNPGEEWLLTPEPLLRLGTLADTPVVQQFHRIDAVTRLGDGTVVVLNAGSGELRAFSASGTHLWSAGGLGQGPGEISGGGRKSLWRLPGDTLLVRSGLYRITRGPGGELVDHSREESVMLGNCARMFVPGLVERHVACGNIRRSGTPGPWVFENTVLRVDSAQERVDTIATFFREDGWRGRDAASDINVDIQSPLGPKGTLQYSRYEPKLVYARNDAYRFEFWDLSTGALSMVVERRTPRRARTATEIALEVRWGMNPTGVRAELRADDHRFSVADSLSIVESFFLDPLGVLWVRRAPSPSEGDEGILREVFSPETGEKIGDVRLPSGLHDVFRPDGVYLGTVKLPHDLREVEIGPDYVLGVARDELGMEHVRVYGLDRGR